jgi:hypothetical protein
MTFRIFLAGILGGVVMFIWNFVGHDLLPLGHAGIHEIPNEAVVLDAMKANIGENHGVYLFPGLGYGDNPTREQESEGMKQMPEKLANNPSGFLVYHPQGRQFVFARLLGVEFATDLLESILVVFLLAQTRIGGFAGRVGFVLVAGILAAVATNVPYWNWYGFPKHYVAAYMTIQIVGFICVGIVAALVIGKSMSQASS